jgi:hypothetical protein
LHRGSKLLGGASPSKPAIQIRLGPAREEARPSRQKIKRAGYP